MRISERVDNAVRAMAELAASETSSLKAEAIATSQHISLKYLLDILRDLKLAELVRSKRGPDGGFTLARPPSAMSLADLVTAELPADVEQLAREYRETTMQRYGPSARRR